MGSRNGLSLRGCVQEPLLARSGINYLPVRSKWLIDKLPNKKRMIICGDFNAKISGYLCSIGNLGGEELERIVNIAGLRMLNSKDQPTRREHKKDKII